MSSDFDKREFRNALRWFATGITVVTTQQDDHVHGMTCNAFMSVSLDPPLVLISIGQHTKMHERLFESGRYGISILSAEQKHLSNHFAGRPLPNLTDPFVEIDGMALLKGANVHLIADIVDTHEAGDHTLFIREVTNFIYQEDSQPLLFHAGQYGLLADAN